MIGKIKVLAVVAATLFVPVAAVAGQVKFQSATKTWDTAAAVDLARGEYVLFARLDPSGDRRFITWTAAANDRIEVVLSVPVDATDGFQPQLVLFQPENTTAGPALPFDQPPDTMAMIYPAKQELRSYEGLTQIRYTTVFQKTLTLPVAGRYYLAVYNPSRYPGTVRLTVDSGRYHALQAACDYPIRWWYSQVWAGLSPETLFFPGVVIAVVSGTVILAVIWRRPSSRVNQPRREKAKIKPVKKK